MAHRDINIICKFSFIPFFLSREDFVYYVLLLSLLVLVYMYTRYAVMRRPHRLYVVIII